MDVNTFLQIGIVGIGLSALIEVIQGKFGTGSLFTKAITIVLSVALGSAWFFLQGTPLLETIIGILGVATVFYAFFLK